MIYLNVKLEVFKKNDSRNLRLVQNITRMVRFQPIHMIDQSAVRSGRKLSQRSKAVPLLITTISENLEYQLKLVDKAVYVVERTIKRKCGTQQRYSMGKPENFYPEIGLFATKKEKKKYQQNVFF